MSDLSLPTGWTLRPASADQSSAEHLYKAWRFKDFKEALRFVSEVGRLAETLHHHPDITLGWGYVTLSLTTHDEGGVTALDVKLASAIEDLNT